MNYLSQLTEDEVHFICSVLPYKETVAYFTRHPKEFTKIRPGFRANAISKYNVSNLLFSYRNKLFISKFIEKYIGVWLSQIQEHIRKCLEDGESKDLAFIHTLPFCFFADNVNLYFNLVNEEYPEEYIALLSVTVKVIKESTNKQERLNEDCDFSFKLRKPISQTLINQGPYFISNEKKRLLNYTMFMHNIHSVIT